MESTIKDFEAAIAELETIVKKLEEGDLPLESSLQLYERGVHLSRYCHARLEEAERYVARLKRRPLRLGNAGKDDGAASAYPPHYQRRKLEQRAK